MDASHFAEYLPTHARWAPCSRACYLTLHWPGVGHMGEREAVLPPTCLPQLPQLSHRLLASCDEGGLRRLVQFHMQRLRGTSLFLHSGKCFECVAQRVADYVVEACGGPLYYSERHSRLQAGAGFPLLLDVEGREIWLVQLWHAFDDVGLSARLRADYWNWAEPLSVHLLAPQARHQGLTRYPFDTVRSWFPVST